MLAQVATTKYYELGGLKTTGMYLSQIWRLAPEIRMSACLGKDHRAGLFYCYLCYFWGHCLISPLFSYYWLCRGSSAYFTSLLSRPSCLWPSADSFISGDWWRPLRNCLQVHHFSGALIKSTDLITIMFHSFSLSLSHSLYVHLPLIPQEYQYFRLNHANLTFSQ